MSLRRHAFVIALCAAAALPHAPVMAQGSVPTRELALPAAEALLLDSKREIRRARRAIEQAEADVMIAGQKPNPQLAACRTWGVESENRPQRGQFLPHSPPHSPAMGQEGGEKWTAVADLQPTIRKSDRLLGVALQNINRSRGIGAGGLRDKTVDSIVGVSQLVERGGKAGLRVAAAQSLADAKRGDSGETVRTQLLALRAGVEEAPAAADARPGTTQAMEPKQ